MEAVLYALLAAVLVALFPQRFDTIADTSLNRLGWSAAYGTLGVLLALPVMIVLMVSCVGIPLILVEVALIVAAWFAGRVGISLALGSKIVEAINRPAISAIWAAAVGSLVISLVRLIPVAGDIVVLVLGIIGFGAVLVTGFGSHPDWFANRFSRGTGGSPRS